MMMSYVDCLSGESSVTDLTPPCFSPEAEDAVRLLPRKLGPNQPKPGQVQTKPGVVQCRPGPFHARAEGSLRRRLLSARVHHQYAAMQSHAPPPPNHSAAWGSDQEVKGNTNLAGQYRSGFGTNRRTSCSSPNPEPRSGFTRTHPLLSTATPPLKYQDADLLQALPPQFKYKPKKRRRWFRRKKNREATPSTPLLYHARDPDRRWSVHYTTHKPLHGLLFLPSTTRGSEPSSPEPVLSLNQNGPASFASGPRIHQSERSRGFEWRRRSRKMSSVDSDDDERLVLGGTRPMTPLVLTSCWDGPAATCEEGGTSCGLPTPEEVTRRRAQTVVADIVPINITGESLERQASLHRSLSQRDHLYRRPSVNRTRPGLNTDHSQDYSQDQGPDRDYSQDYSQDYSLDQQDQGRELVQSSTQSPSRTRDQDQDQKQRSRSEPRRIRAPRGDLSSLMHTLTSSKRLHPQEVPPSTSCLQSSDSSTYRTIYYSPADAEYDSESVCSALEPWTYQALTPSSSVLSAQDTGSVCGEGWSYEPLLCSASPSHQSLRSDLEENSLCYGPNSDKMAASASLNFLPNSSPSYDSLRSESTSNTSHVLNLNKMAASCSPSCSSLHSESLSNASLNLDRTCSQSQASLSSAGSSLSRSFSLRKSKRPPAPPLRNQSLRGPTKSPTEPPPPQTLPQTPPKSAPEPPPAPGSPGPRPLGPSTQRPKPPRPSLQRRRRGESSTPCPDGEKVDGLIPTQFGDPWVPRMKKRQSGLNCGTTTTFAPKEEEQNITYNTTTVQAEPRLQRLASPSSGYSSQSNTPLSSPLSPSSPDTPLPQLPPQKDPPQSRPKSRSRPRSGLKPRPPERTTSLLSSSSSSSSSLSSCMSSSEVSVKGLPAPPPPPPLPPFNQQLPVCLNSKTQTNAPNRSTPLPPLPPPKSLPSPPPLPVFNHPLPASYYQIRTHPSNDLNSSIMSHSPPSPPPPPPLPPSFSLPLPPPLPDSNPKLLAFSYKICNSPLKGANLQNGTSPEHSAVSPSSLPLPPPLPPPSHQPLPVTRKIHDMPQNLPQTSNKVPNSPPPYPQSFSRSKMSPKLSPNMSAPSSPLVTTQVLKNVKLRSVKSQEFTRTNSLPMMDATKPDNDKNANLELLRKKANSASSVNETPGIHKQEQCTKEDLSQEAKYYDKDPQEGSSATKNNCKAGLEISEELKTHLSAKTYNDPDCNQVKSSDDLTRAESRLPEQCEGKVAEVFIPNFIAENGRFEQPEEAKVYITQNDKSDYVHNDTDNTEGAVISNTFAQEDSTVMTRGEVSIEKKSQVSEPKECWTEAEMNQEIGLDEIETILRVLDASVVESEEVIDQSTNVDLTMAKDMIYDTDKFKVTETGQTLDWSPDSEVCTEPEQSVSDSPETSEVLLMEDCHKTVAAEICSSDLKIQSAQITDVTQYKLQTTENYFRTQNRQDLEDVTNDLSQDSVFKERHQAYLDMYAMLAESTATRLNQDDGLRDILNSDDSNVQRKRQKSKSKVKYSYYDVNKADVNKLSDKTSAENDHETLKERHLNRPGAKTQTRPQDCDVYEAEESQYWSLCRGGREEEKTFNQTKTRSPVKPALPTKPDLGILGLLNRTTKRDDKMSPGKAQNSSTNHSSNSPRRDKPPIPHKKPDLATQQSPKKPDLATQTSTRNSPQKPDLATLTSTQSKPRTQTSTQPRTSEQVWRNLEDSAEVWTVRKSENNSLFSKTTTLENYGPAVYISTESFKNQSANDRNAEEIFLNRSALEDSGFIQNGLTNFSRKTSEHCAKEETANSTFVDTTTTNTTTAAATSMHSTFYTVQIGDPVFSPGPMENSGQRFESDDVIWESLESAQNGCSVEENGEDILRFENHQNSWMENLENLSSYKSRLTNIENSNENIWSLRNAEKELEIMEEDVGFRGFCAMENYHSFGDELTEQEHYMGVYGRQNVNIPSQIWATDCDFGTDIQRRQCMPQEECVMGRMPMKKPPRRKKQNQTLLMHQEKERSSLSSSSLSSSSESETVMSEESGRLIGQSCLSLSSALSTDSLKGELSLPDLLIQEPGEEEEHDVFGGVSADEVTVPAQTRSTDDLFAVIHRSKRKMFGRKDSGVFSSSSTSSPSPPVTPAEPRPASRVQRSPHTHSFKALLLKKGVHFGSVSRVSAVERLCRPYSPYTSTSCMPRPLTPPCGPLTPPCIAGRWFSSRTRVHTAPMAAILEHHDEEDQQNEEQYEEQDGDDDVFEFS